VVAIPQIPSDSSGHREWHGAIRSRIWTPKPAVSQPQICLGMLTLSGHLDSDSNMPHISH